MRYFNPEEKQLAKSFLVYQAGLSFFLPLSFSFFLFLSLLSLLSVIKRDSGQPGGLPRSKAELEVCYGFYVQLQPEGTSVPLFIEVLIFLNRMRMLRSSPHHDTISYARRVCQSYFPLFSSSPLLLFSSLFSPLFVSFSLFPHSHPSTITTISNL
jgi:hypothetical protein